MKNYTNLLEFLNKKRLVSAKIKTYLVVKKEEIAQGVDEIRNSASQNNLIKSQIQILLKRQLSDQESLMHSFEENGSNQEQIDLDLKKNFFYVIDPDGKIIDCAKIYSFLHEDNIYQRIVAKTL